MRGLYRLLLASTALAPFAVFSAGANPLGPNIVGGSATVTGVGTNSVVITQTGPRTVIDWRTFNIAPGETTRFIQPSAGSVVLNRVTGNLGPSTINGTLTANGGVYLINPYGILIGGGAVINTASFLATTSDIRNEDFLAGRNNFTIPGRPDASIVNLGTITAQNMGFAALVAPGVRNAGTITANFGRVALASGNTFSLDFYGDRLITLSVNDQVAASVKDVATGQTLGSLVRNEGKLKANGGQVQLSAVSARQVVNSVINNSGVIEARTIGKREGKIVLSAPTSKTKPADAPEQTVVVAGTLDVSSRKAKAGTVEVTGENIQVTGATIKASGWTGGGTVLIGGDVGGGNPNALVASIPQAKLQAGPLPNATTVSVDAATTIDASATSVGDAGKVVVWADGRTNFSGTILAHGGPLAGNGGFVEVSGKLQLAFNGHVDTRAPHGTAGTLLLDPDDFVIDSSAASTIVSNLSGGNVIIQTTLAGTGGLGDITVNAPITWSGANSLTLSAYRNVVVNANITNSSGVAAVVLRADNTGTGVGTVSFASGSMKVSTAGTVSIFFNPSVNPTNDNVNGTSYVSPTENYSANVAGGATLTSYMLVNTVYDLQNISNNLSGTYALGRDIDFAGAPMTPLGRFSGILDGQNKTIGGVSLSGRSLVEFNDGTITNLNLVNITVTGTADGQLLGLLASTNNGTISNVTASGTVSAAAYTSITAGGLVGINNNNGTITGSSSSANITVGIGGGDANIFFDAANAGGLVGVNRGLITLSSATGNVTGDGNSIIGGLVGSNFGRIEQSYATGTVQSVVTSPAYAGHAGGLVGANSDTIISSFASGNVSSAGSVKIANVGGLVGQLNGSATIISSYATGNVSINNTVTTTTDSSSAGGLVGYAQPNASISDSYALGSVTVSANPSTYIINAGGLVGYNNQATVTRAYATGAVTSTGTAAARIGGFFGDVYTGTSVTGGYWDIGTTGRSNPSFGVLSYAGISGLSTVDARRTLSYGSFDFTNTWVMVNGGTRPFLRSEFSTTIANLHQFQLALLSGAANYKLANDIDAGPELSNPASMWGPGGFVPFTYYSGTFDGQNYTIANISLNAPTLLASNSGTIKDVTFANIGLHATTNNQYVGVIGQNLGTISNVNVSGTIDGGAYRGIMVGGLVGINGQINAGTVVGGTISRSSSAMNITVGDGGNCFFGPCEAGVNIAGGLVGWNPGTVSQSFATGSVTVGSNAMAGGLVGVNQKFNNATNVVTPTIDQSYATGAVTSTGVNIQIGGLVGFNVGYLGDIPNSGLIRNSRATGAVTANHALSTPGDCSLVFCEFAYVGGLVGFNQGTITSTVTPVVNAYPALGVGTYATGAVRVGQSGLAGGLVGWSDGLIEKTLAVGAVTGLAGTINQPTQLGGLVGQNHGWIVNSSATGPVGTLGVSFLAAGGLVANNTGTIINSTASGAVKAGNDSSAGGLANNNEIPRFDCILCFRGVAYNSDAIITGSESTGAVTVGVRSVAGGFVAFTSSGIVNSSSSGIVTAGDESIVGGFAGVISAESIAANSNATGNVIGSSNSWIGGFAGVNVGFISLGSSSSGTVQGNADSVIGGLVGLNLGNITAASTSSSVTGTGTNNVIGGLVGANFGTIFNSHSSGDVTANLGTSNSNLPGNTNASSIGVAGSLVGANGNIANAEPGQVLGSTFPAGIIIASTGTGLVNGVAGSQVGSTTLAALPKPPAVLNSCDDALCEIMRNPKLIANTTTVDIPDDVFLISLILNTLTVPDKQQQADIVNSLIQLTPPSGPTQPVGTNDSPAGPGNRPTSSAPGTPPPSFAPPPVLRPVEGPNGERFSSLPPLNETRFFNNEVVLQVGLNVSSAELQRLANELGLQVITTQNLDSTGRSATRFRLPPGMNVRQAIRLLESRSIVAIAQPNYVYRVTQPAAAAGPRGDPAQYMMSKLDLEAVHRLATGAGVLIAVIDSEVDKKHSELTGVVSQELDALGVTEKAHPHGTAMVGAIVSRDRLLGVAPGARIIAVRAFGETANSAEGTTYNILKGIEWAVSKGARVINMSFAGPYDPSLERALKAARDKGVILVAAAGNAGPKSPALFPGADPNVIAVTATDSKDRLFRQANQGGYVSVASPGVEILAPAPDEAYQMSTGTSIATAHVTGVIALMLERDPTLTPADVRLILESTATDLGPPGKDKQFGWGMVNPQKALAAVEARKRSATTAAAPVAPPAPVR